VGLWGCGLFCLFGDGGCVVGGDAYYVGLVFGFSRELFEFVSVRSS